VRPRCLAGTLSQRYVLLLSILLTHGAIFGLHRTYVWALKYLLCYLLLVVKQKTVVLKLQSVSDGLSCLSVLSDVCATVGGLVINK